MSREQNAGKNHNMRIDNKSFDREEQFKYSGTTITKQVPFMKKLRTD
jgi:hypothetical protein